MSKIEIGQAVHIKLSETARDCYRSRLVESSKDDYFIDVPLHEGEHNELQWSKDRQVWVEYQSADGTKCRFLTTVEEVVRMPAPAWRIKKPETSSIIREQRREFVRVSADLPVRLEYILEGGARQVEVRTIDISGGGLALAIPRDVLFRAGLMVDIKLTLPNDNYPVHVKCFVIRVSDRNERGIAMASLQFLNIKEPVRQKIIQYTFYRQRMAKQS